MKSSLRYLVLLLLATTVSLVLKQTSINAEPTTIPQQTYLISNQQVTSSLPGSLSISGRFSAQDKNQDKLIGKNEIIDFTLDIDDGNSKVTCHLPTLSDFKFSDPDNYIQNSLKINQLRPNSRERYEKKAELIRTSTWSIQIVCNDRNTRISLNRYSDRSYKLEIIKNDLSSQSTETFYNLLLDVRLLLNNDPIRGNK